MHLEPPRCHWSFALVFTEPGHSPGWAEDAASTSGGGGVQLGWEGFMLAQCHAGYHARWSALSRASVLQGQESWGVW